MLFIRIVVTINMSFAINYIVNLSSFLFSYYFLFLVLFFLFKQKTAYEMRISDWSSDVCSSDLDIGSQRVEGDSRIARGARHARIDVGDAYRNVGPQFGGEIDRDAKAATAVVARRSNHAEQRVDPQPLEARADIIVAKREEGDAQPRSEEHTSELQSLMRISYAVFCLKKKNT